MAKFEVLVTDLRHRDYEIESKLLKEIDADLILKDCKDENELASYVKDIDAIISDLTPITEEVINNCNKCKVISESRSTEHESQCSMEKIPGAN